MSYEEMKADCDDAHNRGPKVYVHTGCAEATKVGVWAGPDPVEHGYQLDEEACELVAERGVCYGPGQEGWIDKSYRDIRKRNRLCG